jgi:hypothetical protein
MSEPETKSAHLLRQADPAELCDWTHTNRTLRHVPSAAASFEDVLMSSYWLRCATANLLAQNDIVICIPAAADWFAQVLVREVGPEYVKVMLMFGTVFQDAVLPPGVSRHAAGEEASFYFAGPLLKWQVLRNDGSVLKSGLATQGEAAAWLAEHRKMQQRSKAGP